MSSDEKLKSLTLLSGGDFEAFLYDCDGTLADTMPGHKKSYVRVAAESGIALDEAIIDEFAGLPIIKVIEEINHRYGTGFDPVKFSEEKENIFLSEYFEQTQPIDYVVNHLRSHAGKVKIGVVSGSVRDTVQRTLELLGIADIPQVLVCAGETPHGKPWPDPFLSAARQLGADPKKCLVFEDGEPGTQAAEAAGMKWVRIDKV